MRGDEFSVFSTNDSEVRSAAENGNTTAQVLLGWKLIESSLPKYDKDTGKWIYETEGTNVVKRETEAVNWFRKAAERGRVDAEYNLGSCYANGFGVEKDEAEAAKRFRKAAEQGDADAQVWLGSAYEHGRGVETNAVEAAKWYRKAAEQGDLDAQKILAVAYFTGFMFVERDAGQACKWFRKAAEQGDITSQTSLALILRYGDYPYNDLETDPNEAAKWYLRAARQGDSHAQLSVGEMYEKGEGLRQDYVEAYKWFNIAGAFTEKPAVAQTAKEERDPLAQQMTPSQIAEGQRLSAAFIPSKEMPTSSPDKFTSPDNPTATGTGFFITDDGYLISNYHVVKDASQIRLLTGTGMIPARVVQVDSANDIALLKADGKFSPLPVAASRTVHLGSTVATIGFPDIGLQGFAPKLAKGEIASLSGAQDDPRYFQISVPVQPGNSGGALVDERGNVVGIVSAKLSASAALAETGALPENVNYAIKSSFLLSFLESVPDVTAKSKPPNTQTERFEDVVKSAQKAAVLVVVY